MATIPQRILFVRPDSYGDVVLFEPVLRLIRQAWPKTKVAVLIRAGYADLTALMPRGVHWLTTNCDPYREGPSTNPQQLNQLRQTILEFAPDCLVAACYSKTWLEAFAATVVPTARQISLGPYDLDPISQVSLSESVPLEWSELYRETVPTDRNTCDWEKNLALTSYLLEHAVPQQRPQLVVPKPAQKCAQDILETAALADGNFVACCPAGTLKVSLKAWPVNRFATVLTWLYKHHGVRALLVGHDRERAILDQVDQATRRLGGQTVVWTGKDGEFPVLAALLARARFYFGNDTAAMHIAAALDRPVAAIFGGGDYPRFLPVARRAVWVVQPLPCFGCGWNCDLGTPVCVQAISTKKVIPSIQKLLDLKHDDCIEVRVTGAVSAAELRLITNVAAARPALTSPTGPVGVATVRRSDLINLMRHLRGSEADRAARLEVINRQGVEMGKLQEEIHRWLEQLRRLGVNAYDATTKNTALQLRLDDLNQQFAQVEADRAARLEVINLQGVENGNLKQENNRWQEQLRQLQHDLDRTRCENAKLQQELVGSREQLGSVRNELQQARGIATTTISANSDLTQQLAATTAREVLGAATVQRQQAELDKLREQLGHWTNEAHRATASLDQAAADIAQLRVAFGALQEQSRRELSDQAVIIEKQRLQQERLQEQLEQTRGALQSVESQLAASAQQGHRLTQEKQELARTLAATLESLGAARGRVDELNRILTRLDRHWPVRWLWKSGRGKDLT